MAASAISRSLHTTPPRLALFGAICAAHLLLLLALLMTGRITLEKPSAALQAVLLSETPQIDQPPLPDVSLQRLEPRDVSLPLIELTTPIDPSATAITVAMSEPPPASAPPSAPVGSGAPLIVEAVEYLRPPAPRYPPAARHARHEGLVELLVRIDGDGLARDIRIEKSSGYASLDSAAIDSVRAARFKPYEVNGVARSVIVVVPIEFSLRLRSARR